MSNIQIFNFIHKKGENFVNSYTSEEKGFSLKDSKDLSGYFSPEIFL